MEPVGTTAILVTGPHPDVEKFKAVLLASATERHEFSLHSLFPEMWGADPPYPAELDGNGESLHMTVCLPGDMNAFAIAKELSRRHPGLAFDSHYWGELSEPDFTKARHVDGRERFRTEFSLEYIATFASEHGGRRVEKLGFYRRTAARTAALRYSGKTGMGLFLRRDAAPGGWRRSDDLVGYGHYLLPSEAGGFDVLALSLPGGGHLLEGVDLQGGFGRSIWMAAGVLAERFPDLAADLPGRMLGAAAGQSADPVAEPVDGICF